VMLREGFWPRKVTIDGSKPRVIVRMAPIPGAKPRVPVPVSTGLVDTETDEPTEDVAASASPVASGRPAPGASAKPAPGASAKPAPGAGAKAGAAPSAKPVATEEPTEE